MRFDLHIDILCRTCSSIGYGNGLYHGSFCSCGAVLRGVAGGDAVYGYGFCYGHIAGGVRKGEGLELVMHDIDGDGRLQLGEVGERRTDAFGSRSASTSYCLVFNWETAEIYN